MPGMLASARAPKKKSTFRYVLVTSCIQALLGSPIRQYKSESDLSPACREGWIDKQAVETRPCCSGHAYRCMPWLHGTLKAYIMPFEHVHFFNRVFVLVFDLPLQLNGCLAHECHEA